jgi:hypothetical protein
LKLAQKKFSHNEIFGVYGRGYNHSLSFYLGLGFSLRDQLSVCVSCCCIILLLPTKIFKEDISSVKDGFPMKYQFAI